MRRAERGGATVCPHSNCQSNALRLALLGSTTILLSVLLAPPLHANDECGTAPSAICDSGDADYPIFLNGITYDPVADLTGELAARAGIAALYVDLALRHKFLGETSAEVSSLSFSDELPGTVVRLASGLAWSFADDRFNLSLDAAYAKGEDAEEMSASAALRLVN